MSSPEKHSTKEQDPRLHTILGEYGHVLVLNHQGLPQALSQAVVECPPFAHALIAAETPKKVQEIVNALKAPE